MIIILNEYNNNNNNNKYIYVHVFKNYHQPYYSTKPPTLFYRVPTSHQTNTTNMAIRGACFTVYIHVTTCSHICIIIYIHVHVYMYVHMSQYTIVIEV